MRDGSAVQSGLIGLPDWVPRPALNYLAHTESGATIRALARHSGCHASTVLRQIRRYETRRDDLLVDQALRRLGRQVMRARAGSPEQEIDMSEQIFPEATAATLSEARLEKEARRILRALCETGAVLAVAAEMDKAVVVRDTDMGGTLRTAVADREIAEAMALKQWIACSDPARISRYQITRAGREALGRMVADAENRAVGFAEAPAGFDGAEATVEDFDAAPCGSRRARYNLAETPLTALARRKDRDGQPFLAEPLVRAGERLREDFELARLGPRGTANWDIYVAGASPADTGETIAGSAGARARVAGALRDLGPGLGDVVLRCCCYLEGLEQTERSMGWSARSGKIVLRIALQRLKRHYDGLGDAAGLIG